MPSSRVVVCGALLVGFFVAACGGSAASGEIGPGADADADADGGSGEGDGGAADGASGDAGAADAASDGPFETAAHGPLPQVADLGGTILNTPKVQLIAYAADPVASDIDKMATELTQTSTWSEQTSEYGVGPLTKLPTIQITGTPPTMLDDNSGNPTPFQQTLIDNLSGAKPAWGAPDPSTIYTFLLPQGTDINSGGSCCSAFLGYHWQVTVGSTNVSYAVVCDCPASPPLTQLQGVTTTVNHELVEAATDPLVSSSPAYAQADDADAIWTIFTGGEIADMCEYNADANYTPSASTYMVQRTWSNAAAKAGKNPCVPVPNSGPFFDSVPVLTDKVTLNYGTAVTTTGVRIPVGSSKTIDVQLFSEAPTAGPWTVTAYDLNGYLGQTANTTVSLDNTHGSNGDVLHLTIKVLSKDPNTGGEGFVLVSDLNGQENISVGAIGN